MDQKGGASYLPYTSYLVLTCRLQESKLPRALLLTAQTRIPSLWRSVANEFNKRASLALIRDDDGLISQHFGIESGAKDGKAKILYWNAGSAEAEVYEGRHFTSHSMRQHTKLLLPRET